MADLISRAAAIDAIVSATAFPDAEYIKNLCQNPANSEDWLGGVCDAINAVEDVNTVDAVPVVRCRDCKYYAINRLTKAYEPDKRFNPSVCIIGEFARPRKPDWYCADGERRDSE